MEKLNKWNVGLIYILLNTGKIAHQFYPPSSPRFVIFAISTDQLILCFWGYFRAKQWVMQHGSFDSCQGHCCAALLLWPLSRALLLTLSFLSQKFFGKGLGFWARSTTNAFSLLKNLVCLLMVKHEDSCDVTSCCQQLCSFLFRIVCLLSFWAILPVFSKI